MALPQQVIDRLSQEPPKTPGWSVGLLTFATGIFFISVLIYFGLAFGYEPYVGSQITSVNAKIAALAQSISADDQTKLITFYSEITNIKTALANHIALSHLFAWLEKDTEANVYFSSISFGSGNQITLTGIAKTEADVNQQVAIFETAPEVQVVALSNVALSGSSDLWQFSVLLTMDPVTVLQTSPQVTVAATTTTQ